MKKDRLSDERGMPSSTYDIVGLVGIVGLTVPLDGTKGRAAGKDASPVGPVDRLLERAFALLYGAMRSRSASTRLSTTLGKDWRSD
jgi:hypothetical protein